MGGGRLRFRVVSGLVTIQELKNFGLHKGVIVEDRFIYCDSARLQGTCTTRPVVRPCGLFP